MSRSGTQAGLEREGPGISAESQHEEAAVFPSAQEGGWSSRWDPQMRGHAKPLPAADRIFPGLLANFSEAVLPGLVVGIDFRGKAVHSRWAQSELKAGRKAGT